MTLSRAWWLSCTVHPEECVQESARSSSPWCRVRRHSRLLSNMPSNARRSALLAHFFSTRRALFPRAVYPVQTNGGALAMLRMWSALAGLALRSAGCCLMRTNKNWSRRYGSRGIEPAIAVSPLTEPSCKGRDSHPGSATTKPCHSLIQSCRHCC